MKRLMFALSSLMMMAVASAQAADTVIWSGWMDFGSCNRIKYYKDDFGITWPTNESVGQEIRGEIYLASTIDEVIKNRLQTCALKGVAAAGMSAIFTSGGSAWPVFKTAFAACVQGEGLSQIALDTISIRTETVCRW